MGPSNLGTGAFGKKEKLDFLITFPAAVATVTCPVNISISLIEKTG